MHDAMEVAEYVLSYCENEIKHPITNLQLQKFLYYIQGTNLLLTGKPMFDNDIIAWQYGPVVPDVYYYYSNYNSKEISNVSTDGKNFTKYEKKIIKSVVNKLIGVYIWDIVKETHKQKPWIDNERIRNKISTSEIKSWFEENRRNIWNVCQKKV